MPYFHKPMPVAAATIAALALLVLLGGCQTGPDAENESRRAERHTDVHISIAPVHASGGTAENATGGNASGAGSATGSTRQRGDADSTTSQEQDSDATQDVDADTSVDPTGGS